jgi:alpha-glucosidase
MATRLTPFSSAFYLLAVVISFTGFSSSCKQPDQLVLKSPDGSIGVVFHTNSDHPARLPSYDIVFNGHPILKNADLGIELKGKQIIGVSSTLLDTEETTIDETYIMPFGKSSEIRNHANETSLQLRDKNGIRLSVIFRLYNDGVGFRYYFPEQDGLNDFEITRELTSFHFDVDCKYWGIHLDSYRTSYEKEYTTDLLSAIGSGSILGVPFLARASGDAWMAITEAALVNYAGMYLKSAGQNSLELIASLSPRKDDPDVCVKGSTPMYTPWRAIMIADDPGRFVESNFVLNLNQPCTFDFSWVKPGLAIDDWNNDQTVKSTGWEGAMDTRTMKHFIDFCADYGLAYMSIDAGWYGADWSDTTLDLTRPVPEIDIPLLVEYAKERNVDIFLWTLSHLMKKQIDEVLPLFNQWGIKGFNVDFFDSDDQATVNLVNAITKKAAEHQLHVEFHGIYKPTGLSRTYPNLLAHEAVLGLEYSKWDRKPTPEHNCILPFTRMLAGPMDYIVAGFTNKTAADFEIVWDEFNTLGTRCHQLATLIIFETGFQVLGDYPDNYRDKAGSDLFRHIPVQWDESRVLHARVGDYITIARRHKQQWFIGTITDWTERDLAITLRFLDEGEYHAEIYEDGPNANNEPTEVRYYQVTVNNGTTLNIPLAGGGGHVARIYPVKCK